jgi:TRAP-type C4-dicarboxylate transport system permease small subunit
MIASNRALMASIERVLRTTGVACLLAVMVIVFCDVAARYLWNAPFPWSYELIGMYLMPAMFYFSVSDTLASDHHIAVDLLRPAMPAWLIRLTEILGNGAMASVFAVVVWLFSNSAAVKFQSGDVVMGVVEWPAWIPDAIVALGSLVIALRLAGRSIGHALSLARGRNVIDLPPMVGGH